MRLSLHDTFHKLNFKDLLDCHKILYYNKIHTLPTTSYSSYSIKSKQTRYEKKFEFEKVSRDCKKVRKQVASHGAQLPYSAKFWRGNILADLANSPAIAKILPSKFLPIFPIKWCCLSL